ncbi:SdpI family protein [Jongsikchunia kroppenstedtii]|uniref:SdpI family protein n=1 Tax=Jongsikchunia kroppenstedtii TaxID=1121721 RepID=UPI000362B830|nr:SdpI family protein [Jongsikchunia kroppenstedtii]
MNVLAVALAVVALILCVAFVAVGVAGVTRRLTPDSWAGIRTSATLHSDAAWTRAHQVAGPGLICAGLVALLGTIVGLAASGGLAVVAVIVALLVAVPLAGWVSGVGIRAAQAVVTADLVAAAGAAVDNPDVDHADDGCETGSACASCSLAGACKLPS